MRDQPRINPSPCDCGKTPRAYRVRVKIESRMHAAWTIKCACGDRLGYYRSREYAVEAWNADTKETR